MADNPQLPAEYVCPRCRKPLAGDWGDSRGVLWICYACEEAGEEGQTAFYAWELEHIDGCSEVPDGN